MATIVFWGFIILGVIGWISGLGDKKAPSNKVFDDSNSDISRNSKNKYLHKPIRIYESSIAYWKSIRDGFEVRTYKKSVRINVADLDFLRFQKPVGFAERANQEISKINESANDYPVSKPRVTYSYGIELDDPEQHPEMVSALLRWRDAEEAWNTARQADIIFSNRLRQAIRVSKM